MSGNTSESFGKYIVYMWLAFIGLFAFSILWFMGVSNGMLGELPSFEEIENPDSFLATEVYSEDNKLLGKYYSENRSNITYAEIEGLIANTLIATEDIRFYKHSGIDLRALLRAVKGLGSDGGGSTISQQLAKNLFRTRAQEIKDSGIEVKRTILEKIAGTSKLQTIFAKMKEWVIAVRLEQSYTKEEIITMYLNTVEFSDNAFGIKSAARTYFNKNVTELHQEEAAVLVGMLRAPYKYNPRIHPENALNVRETVFDQLLRYEYISTEVRDSLNALPLALEFTRGSHIDGAAPYFRETLRSWLKEWAKGKFKPDGTNYSVYNDGLRIYTTINSTMQQYAEEAVKEHLTDLQSKFDIHWKTKDPWEYYDTYDKEPSASSANERLKKNLVKTFMSRDSTLNEEDALEYIEIEKEMTVWSHAGDIDTVLSPLDSVKYYREFLQTGFMAMDPTNGHVKAWVGGADYKHFQYDHANAGTKRQVGSTFKPLIYALAIKEKGYSPCFKIPIEPITFEKEDKRWHLLEDYTPKNSDGSVGGIKTIKECLATSNNIGTAFLMHELTPEAVIELARNMGIESAIHPGPSIALGAADISLIEMIRAYSTFPNKGVSTEPIFVSRIEDRHGNIIEEFFPAQNEALDEETAYIMAKMMQGVTNPGGTANRIRFRYNIPYSLEVGGKTGTTQSHSDGWFIGYTPELLAGSWVGCEDRYVRFRTIKYGQGASLALPIWALFMKKVYGDESLGYDISAKFQKPDERISVELDCELFATEETEDDGYDNPYVD